MCFIIPHYIFGYSDVNTICTPQRLKNLRVRVNNLRSILKSPDFIKEWFSQESLCNISFNFGRNKLTLTTVQLKFLQDISVATYQNIIYIGCCCYSYGAPFAEYIAASLDIHCFYKTSN